MLDQRRAMGKRSLIVIFTLSHTGKLTLAHGALGIASLIRDFQARPFGRGQISLCCEYD
jgi:hypothetical protein